ncbi:hypothetical protein V9T40_010789 [Parthenolecanium corni]|uniref:Uncharacterized protein n=1 Tax=Parthenolecanium corni TaxID=536013 RepID=A0AAN9XYU9_9HEMI
MANKDSLSPSKVNMELDEADPVDSEAREHAEQWASQFSAANQSSNNQPDATKLPDETAQKEAPSSGATDVASTVVKKPFSFRTPRLNEAALASQAGTKLFGSPLLFAEHLAGAGAAIINSAGTGAALSDPAGINAATDTRAADTRARYVSPLHNRGEWRNEARGGGGRRYPRRRVRGQPSQRARNAARAANHRENRDSRAAALFADIVKKFARPPRGAEAVACTIVHVTEGESRRPPKTGTQQQPQQPRGYPSMATAAHVLHRRPHFTYQLVGIECALDDAAVPVS